MNLVWLGVGSNLDKKPQIRAALQRLQAEFGLLLLSSVYETEAVGFSGPSFYNLVVGIKTNLSLQSLVLLCKSIEIELGRNKRAARFSSKKIDLDLLLYNEQVGTFQVHPENHENISKSAQKTQQIEVVLPRPDILEQAYVLAPLAEVIPNQIHPITGLSYGAHWRDYQAEAPHAILQVIEVSEFI